MPASIHLLTETERRVYADRAQYLGDEIIFMFRKIVYWIPDNFQISDVGF